MRDASSGDKLKIALFGDLSLEEAMDLSRDRQILELGLLLRHSPEKLRKISKTLYQGSDALTETKAVCTTLPIHK
jgi:hypothetical protein